MAGHSAEQTKRAVMRWASPVPGARLEAVMEVRFSVPLCVRMALVAAALLVVPRDGAAQYSGYVEILEGSVICRQGLLGQSSGPLLAYDAWLKDPRNTTVATDEKSTYRRSHQRTGGDPHQLQPRRHSPDVRLALPGTGTPRRAVLPPACTCTDARPTCTRRRTRGRRRSSAC